MKRFKVRQTYLLSVFILSVFLMSGCGGGGQTGHWLPGDNTAPTVIAVVPLNNAVGVAITTKVTATFSEDMDPSTISIATFTVQSFGPPLGPILAGTVVYDPLTRTATFTPTIPATLAVNTKYQATITTGAADLARNPLAANYVWVFTTGAAPDTIKPRVTVTFPVTTVVAGVVVPTPGVPANTAITATFTKNMNAATIINPATSFTLTCPTCVVTSVTGTVTYVAASRTAKFTPTVPALLEVGPGKTYTATIKGIGASPATDTVGNPLAGNQLPLPTSASDYIWTFDVVVADLIAPTVTLTAPANFATLVPINSTINATFSEAMDLSTISTATFTVQDTALLAPPLLGTVVYLPLTRVATFTPAINLLPSTNYTATVISANDLSGNPLLVPAVGAPANPWTFTTGTGLAPGAVDLGLASTYGTFGGSAGMTNTGNLTVIDGDIGTIATGNSAITGFHERAGIALTDDAYTDTLGANSGTVTGEIYTCTNSTTGPNSAVNLAPATANAADCALATQARLDAQTAFIALAGMASSGAPPMGAGSNLGSQTVNPGVWTAPAGFFIIQGGNLTLDALGDTNAVFVFQMASTLTVGGPGAAFPQSITLINGAQAKNVFWQVGTNAVINAAGGGTMEGTIIANSGVVFSTAGNVAVVTLNGRALSLVSSVTMVNTVINVPLP